MHFYRKNSALGFEARVGTHNILHFSTPIYKKSYYINNNRSQASQRSMCKLTFHKRNYFVISKISGICGY